MLPSLCNRVLIKGCSSQCLLVERVLEALATYKVTIRYINGMELGVDTFREQNDDGGANTFAVSFGVDFHLLDLGVAATWFGFVKLIRVIRITLEYSFNLSITFLFILRGIETSSYERIFGYSNTTSTTTTTEKIRCSIRTWPTFLSPSSFSVLPLPLLYERFNNNLYAFRGNFVIISLFIFFIHIPITTIIFLIIIGTIIYFYLETLDRVVLVSLSLIAIIVVFIAGVWRNVVLSVFRTGFLVSLHATLRISDAHCDTPFATLSRTMQRITDGYTGWFDFWLD